jgi:hypothetical protein
LMQYGYLVNTKTRPLKKAGQLISLNNIWLILTIRRK